MIRITAEYGEFVYNSRSAAGGELTGEQQGVAHEGHQARRHHGCPAQPPMLSSHLRVAGDVLDPAEPSLPASSARAACALVPKKAEICM